MSIELFKLLALPLIGGAIFLFKLSHARLKAPVHDSFRQRFHLARVWL